MVSTTCKKAPENVSLNGEKYTCELANDTTIALVGQKGQDWVLHDGDTIHKYSFTNSVDTICGYWRIKNDTIYYSPSIFKKMNCEAMYPLMVQNKWTEKSNHRVCVKQGPSDRCFHQIIYYPNYYVWVDDIKENKIDSEYNLKIYYSEKLEFDSFNGLDSIKLRRNYDFFLRNVNMYDITTLQFSIKKGIIKLDRKRKSDRYKLPI
jgi:hypothetical protein